MWLHVKRKRSYWKWSVCVLISLHLSKNVSIPLGGRTRSSDSTEGSLGHRVAPCCPLPVMKIKCERFIFSFLFFVIVGRGIWNSSVFYFSFQTKTCPFAPPGCLQSQQDCVVRPLGGRRRYCCFIRYKARRQSAQGGNGKVQTERAANSPRLRLTRSLLRSSVKGIHFNSVIVQLIPPKLELRYDHFTRCLNSIDRNVSCPVALAFSIMNPAFRGVWMWRIPSSTVAWIMFLFSSSFLIM